MIFQMHQHFSKTVTLSLFLSTFLFSFSSSAQTFSNEKIWSGEFRSEGVWGVRSMTDGTHYTTSDFDEAEGSSIVKYSYKSGKKVKTIVTSLQAFEDAREYINDYFFSADERFILLTTNTNQLYRHSFYADFYIYDTHSNELAKPLTDFSKGQQRLATFSPSADKVAFVRNNNVFISNLIDGTETQVTTDGLANSIINGATDWVYEEEFGFVRAFDWGPDSKELVYMRFHTHTKCTLMVESLPLVTS